MRAKCVLTLTLIFLPFLTECGSGRNIEIAEKGVDQFHSDLDLQHYEVIYTAADDNLHNATSELDFVQMLQTVHNKLGTVQRSQLRHFEAGWNLGNGSLVTLQYDTTFSGGEGVEEFVWQVRDKRLLLSGYHITSNAFVVR